MPALHDHTHALVTSTAKMRDSMFSSKINFLLLVPTKCLSEPASDRRRAVYVSYASASVMIIARSPSMIQAPVEISTSDSAEVAPSAGPD